MIHDTIRATCPPTWTRSRRGSNSLSAAGKWFLTRSRRTWKIRKKSWSRCLQRSGSVRKLSLKETGTTRIGKMHNRPRRRKNSLAASRPEGRRMLRFSRKRTLSSRRAWRSQLKLTQIAWKDFMSAQATLVTCFRWVAPSPPPIRALFRAKMSRQVVSSFLSDSGPIPRQVAPGSRSSESVRDRSSQRSKATFRSARRTVTRPVRGVARNLHLWNRRLRKLKRNHRQSVTKSQSRSKKHSKSCLKQIICTGRKLKMLRRRRRVSVKS